MPNCTSQSEGREVADEQIEEVIFNEFRNLSMNTKIVLLANT